MRTIVGGRPGDQVESIGPIELPDNDEMREALDVSQARLKLRQNLEHPLCAVFGPKTFGNLARFLVGAADESDGPRRKHGERFLC